MGDSPGSNVCFWAPCSARAFGQVMDTAPSGQAAVLGAGGGSSAGGSPGPRCGAPATHAGARMVLGAMSRGGSGSRRRGEAGPLESPPGFTPAPPPPPHRSPGAVPRGGRFPGAPLPPHHPPRPALRCPPPPPPPAAALGRAARGRRRERLRAPRRGRTAEPLRSAPPSLGPCRPGAPGLGGPALRRRGGPARRGPRGHEAPGAESGGGRRRRPFPCEPPP